MLFLLSPCPESLYAFEPMWSRLAETTHLVAIDLPGFGRSERRDALMSPRAVGEFIIRVVSTIRISLDRTLGQRPPCSPQPHSPTASSA
jgi:pimeloyl-ACP methyl ester carboxylesterase